MGAFSNSGAGFEMRVFVLYFELRPREASLGFANHQWKNLPDPESRRLFFILFPGMNSEPALLCRRRCRCFRPRIHQQKLFHLPVSVLGASPISLARPATDSPYLFLQLCCKNKITKPIKLLAAQLNTSQLCC